MCSIKKIAFVALAAASLAMPAFAQDEIIVQAPSTRHVDRTSGVPIETYTAHRVISTRDLDLRYAADVRELRRRIDFAARDACAELDYRVPNFQSSAVNPPGSCRAEAIKSARLQVDYRY